MMVRINSFIEEGSLAYVFPGQGAQYVGMGQQLYHGSDGAKSVLDQIDKVLNRPLTKLMFNGPEDELRQTVNAQPAIMAVSLACIMAMTEQLESGNLPPPKFVAGHSLGEYTALFISDVLTLEETAWLIQERARLMQDACEENDGHMAAILGLDEITVTEIAMKTDTYVSNINTPTQIVISGGKQAIANALEMAISQGARKGIPLRVSGAFHSQLMQSAQDGLAESIQKLNFKNPTIPIIANCTGTPLTTAEEIKEELISQMCSCVQWNQSIQFMTQTGITSFVEIGPGITLTSMIKRINKSANVFNISDIDSMSSLSKT